MARTGIGYRPSFGWPNRAPCCQHVLTRKNDPRAGTKPSGDEPWQVGGKAKVKKGSGLYGLDAASKPPGAFGRQASGGADILNCSPRKSLHSSKGFAGDNDAGVVGKGNTGKTREGTTKLVKRLASAHC